MANKEETIELSKTVFENLRSLISHADGKAGIALGLQTLIATSVLGSTLVSDAFNKIWALDPWVRGLFYVILAGFIGTAGSGIISCIMVFKPRPPQEKEEKERSGLTYFGHITNYKDSAEYLHAISKSNDAEVLKDLTFQNFTLAWIVKHKMRYAGYAVNFLFVTVFLGVILLFFGLVMK